MQSSERALTREGESRNSPGKVEAALAHGECTALDKWILDAGYAFSNADPDQAPASHNLTADIFSALFFRQPDHPQLSVWADRAREGLDTLPYPARLTLARRLLRYDIFFGRPARASLLMDSLQGQQIARQRSPVVQIQWGLLQALHLNALSDHTGSLEAVHKAQAVANRYSLQQWNTTLLILKISAQLGLDDVEAAKRSWQDSHAEQAQHGLLGMTHLHQLGAQIALADSNNALALEHAEAAMQLAMRAGAPLFRALACLTATEVHLERGAVTASETVLRQAEQIAQTSGSAQLTCLSAFLRAHRNLMANSYADAEDDLRLGFGLASRHGYKNFLWWSPKMMAALCIKALEQGVETSYVQELVSTHALKAAATPVQVESWPWLVKIYTLGRFTVLVNNQPARAGRKAQHKPLELLKALIAQGGRDVSEDFLTSTLWPDAEGDSARQAFDTTLHRLRKLLGGEQIIQLYDRKLSLDNRVCWVDSWAFERMLSETEAILANPAADPHGAMLARHVQRVYALYHGPFLGKEFGAAWSVSLRERLRSRYLRHIVSVGVRWQQLGRWDLAIENYRRGLEVDDLAEALYQNLMQCHYQLDQRSEALSTYRRCRFILSVVLGIAPSAVTESLYERLRALN
ncbi:MAG: AfsR/SARP family transcriptional regulator [Sulfuricaulis sp.]